MKLLAVSLLAAAALLNPTGAFAQKMNADDLKWVNKCIDDNKGGASPAIIRKYCMCMNEKMDDNETQSITQWEKTHVKERAGLRQGIRLEMTATAGR